MTLKNVNELCTQSYSHVVPLTMPEFLSIYLVISKLYVIRNQIMQSPYVSASSLAGDIEHVSKPTLEAQHVVA